MAKSTGTSRARSPSRKSKGANVVPKSATHASGGGKHHEVEYEFGGPPGALMTMLLLPVVIFFLYSGASKEFKFALSLESIKQLPDHMPNSLEQIWDPTALVAFIAWMAFHVILERVLFFQKGQGVVLATGKRLTYRLSGHLAFWVTFMVLLHGFPRFDDHSNLVSMGAFPLAYIYDNYIQLGTASIIFTTVMSAFLYAKSFKEGALLAKHGDSGNVVYDFFIGRELNPRIGNFDLKEFCELRPGLIGWAVINAGCAAKQFELYGKVSPEMVLINLFQGLYVWDALYHEAAILTTMDITSDGFGWMLCFGDLAWVPFTYSLQARYLVENSPGLSYPVLFLICLLKYVGYKVFRGSNSEKDAFRTNPDSPDVAHLETITTKTGRKLLVSGWWGMARKINYTGDWLMGLAWCSLTGTDCVVTYFYSIYFAVLLIHRAMRDHHACAEKYGADWPRYQAKVPYVFVPGVI